jgi:3-oxoadipate CoA-transferase alpha subunit
VRAGGAGIGGFYTRTGVGTMLAEGKEVRTIDGQDYLFEAPIKADVAFIKAKCGDRWGNLTYNKTARNFGPVHATTGGMTVAEVDEIADLGEIDPEAVVTPGIFVQRVVQVQS